MKRFPRGVAILMELLKNTSIAVRKQSIYYVHSTISTASLGPASLRKEILKDFPTIVLYQACC